MSIPIETLEKIKNDFKMGPDNRLFNLSDQEMEKFWKWFGEKAIKYAVSKKITNGLIGSQNKPAGCFGNSQKISLNNSNKEYCEGFMHSKYGFILHGYNIDYNLVEDYTILSNSKDFIDDKGKLPSEYYGIPIPNDFIEMHHGTDIKDNIMNISHLIELYYKK